MPDNSERINKTVKQIKRFTENVDKPEKWEVVIPRSIFHDVQNRLDTKYNNGSYLNGVRISYTEPYMNDWDETTIKYKSTLSDHIDSIEDL